MAAHGKLAVANAGQRNLPFCCEAAKDRGPHDHRLTNRPSHSNFGRNSRRPEMKRLFMGESLQQSEEAYVPLDSPRKDFRRPRWSLPMGMLRREQRDWLLTCKEQYLREAWRSSELTFQGLALEQSGYRQWLVNSKCPSQWSEYLRR